MNQELFFALRPNLINFWGRWTTYSRFKSWITDWNYHEFLTLNQWFEPALGSSAISLTFINFRPWTLNFGLAGFWRFLFRGFWLFLSPTKLEFDILVTMICFVNSFNQIIKFFSSLKNYIFTVAHLAEWKWETPQKSLWPTVTFKLIPLHFLSLYTCLFNELIETLNPGLWRFHHILDALLPSAGHSWI